MAANGAKQKASRVYGDPRLQFCHPAIRGKLHEPLCSLSVSWAFGFSVERHCPLCILWKEKQWPVGGAGHATVKADTGGAGQSSQEENHKNG